MITYLLFCYIQIITQYSFQTLSTANEILTELKEFHLLFKKHISAIPV